MIVLGDSPTLESDLRIAQSYIQRGEPVIAANHAAAKFDGELSFLATLHHWEPDIINITNDVWFARRTKELNTDYSIITRIKTRHSHIHTGELAVGSGFCVSDSGHYATAFVLERLKSHKAILCGFGLGGRHNGFLVNWRAMWRLNWMDCRDRLVFINNKFRTVVTAPGPDYLTYSEFAKLTVGC